MEVLEMFNDLYEASNGYWSFRHFYLGFQEPLLVNYRNSVEERIRRVERNINLFTVNPDAGEVHDGYIDWWIPRLVEVSNRFEVLETDIERRLSTRGEVIEDREFPIGQRDEFDVIYYPDLEECLPIISFTNTAMRELKDRVERLLPVHFRQYQDSLRRFTNNPIERIDNHENPVIKQHAAPPPIKPLAVGVPYIMERALPEKSILALYNGLLEAGCIDGCGLGTFEAIFSGEISPVRINWRPQHNQLRFFIAELQRMGYVSDGNHFKATADNFTVRGRQFKSTTFRTNDDGPVKHKRTLIRDVLDKANLLGPRE